MSGYHYGRNITPCNLHLDKGKITCDCGSDCGRVVVLSEILAYLLEFLNLSYLKLVLFLKFEFEKKKKKGWPLFLIFINLRF